MWTLLIARVLACIGNRKIETKLRKDKNESVRKETPPQTMDIFLANQNRHSTNEPPSYCSQNKSQALALMYAPTRSSNAHTHIANTRDIPSARIAVAEKQLLVLAFRAPSAQILVGLVTAGVVNMIIILLIFFIHSVIVINTSLPSSSSSSSLAPPFLLELPPKSRQAPEGHKQGRAMSGRPFSKKKNTVGMPLFTYVRVLKRRGLRPRGVVQHCLK